MLSCEPLVGFAPQAGDCDDVDLDVNPAAEEVCNGVDDDCDGETDEGGSPRPGTATTTGTGTATPWTASCRARLRRAS
ncbi:MAG: putative metal-binding motif-containing protein [Alphaproteobacteria bacterium]|nr:putative metal-binding motif-containing protein [Alphaproteobacteria bacterium]